MHSHPGSLSASPVDGLVSAFHSHTSYPAASLLQHSSQVFFPGGLVMTSPLAQSPSLPLGPPPREPTCLSPVSSLFGPEFGSPESPLLLCLTSRAMNMPAACCQIQILCLHHSDPRFSSPQPSAKPSFLQPLIALLSSF